MTETEPGADPVETGAPEPRTSSAAASFDPRMLEALICPVTRSGLKWDAERQELISDAARLAFPVRQGIPIMLVEEARKLED